MRSKNISQLMTFIALTAVIASVPFSTAAQTAVASAKKGPSDRNKIALMVGITNYPNRETLNKIDGCANNVPLHADALRDYGFEDANVLRLADGEATHQKIIDSFQTQLIDRAKAIKANNGEAVVVFYFCGHGSQYPDQDGDEADGLDETLVAYDSRSTSFDILDDEIDDLKAELRRYTTNATFILESCHSGTGTRGGEYISEQAEDDTRPRPPYKRRFPPTSDDDTATYSEIAASLSNRSAKSESAAGCNCDKPYSLMTRSLVQALRRATPTTTYRSLVSEIADEVSRFSQQEPQAGGNRDTLLFGGAAKRTNPYVEVAEIRTGGTVVIKAGAIHGLKEGSQITFYSPESKTNAGSDGWLANGVVTNVGTTNSVVALPKGAAIVTKTSRAILSSPVFGGGAVIVSLSDDADRRSESGGDAVSTAVEKRLRDDALVEDRIIAFAARPVISPLERGAAKSIIRLRRGKIRDIFRDVSQMRPQREANYCDGATLKAVPASERFPSADQEVYYLDGGNSADPPLFGYVFDPASKTLAADIAGAIRSIALMQNLRGLNNAASSLPGNIDVRFETGPAGAVTEVCTADGTKTRQADKEKLSQFRPTKPGSVALGSIARITVKNISGDVRRKTDPYASGEPLYVTILAITTKGEIKVYGGNGPHDPLADGKGRTIYISGDPPIGVEHYIVVVSRDYADFSFYSSWNAAQRDAQMSPLQKILRQSGTATRDAQTVVDRPDTWGVVRLDLNIVKPPPTK